MHVQTTAAQDEMPPRIRKIFGEVECECQSGIAEAAILVDANRRLHSLTLGGEAQLSRLYTPPQTASARPSHFFHNPM